MKARSLTRMLTLLTALLMLLAVAVPALAQEGGEADLTLDVTNAPNPITLGENVTYTLSVGNKGPANATEAEAHLNFDPDEATVVGITQGCTNELDFRGYMEVKCALPDLPVDGSTQVDIVLQPKMVGEFEIFVAAAGHSWDSDFIWDDFDDTNNYVYFVGTTVQAPADTTAPAAPLISKPANNSYDTDGAIAFSGTAEAGSTVRIYEGTTLKTSTTAGTTGAWSKTLPGVANGRHTYTAKATDAANNTSAASAPKTVTVDKIKPKVTSTGPLSGATRVSPGTNVTATFSEAMNANTLRNPTTLRSTTFKLARKNPDGTTTAVAAKVSYSVTTTSTGTKVYKATLNPDVNLQRGKTYAATVSSGAKDVAGNALDQSPTVAGNQSKVWSFKVKP